MKGHALMDVKDALSRLCEAIIFVYIYIIAI